MSEETKRDDQSTGLQKQRRALMASSVIVLFYHYANLRIRNISLLGAGIDIGNPRAVDLGLSVALGYFLFRYHQYYRAEGVSRAIGEAYNRYLQALGARYLLKHAGAPEEREAARRKGVASITLCREHGLSWRLAGMALQAESGKLAPYLQTNLSLPRVLMLKARSALRLSIESHLVTDYWLPFLIAFLASGVACITALIAG